jgi:CO/xanthine dehydrogenase FAD-binding subunit
MDLNSVTQMYRPTSIDFLPEWREGYAWLAGGTWLFSEPQPPIRALVDLESLSWPALKLQPDGLEIAATCTIAELNAFRAPLELKASPLFRECSQSLQASFKIWNAATVGGNICLSLPAGAMIALASALEGVGTIWSLNDSVDRKYSAISHFPSRSIHRDQNFGVPSENASHGRSV